MYLGCRFYPFVYVEFSRISLKKKWITYISMYHQLSNSGFAKTDFLSVPQWLWRQAQSFVKGKEDAGAQSVFLPQ